MHQNCWRLGLCPRPHWGSLQRSPDPLARFKGPTSKAATSKGRGGERLGGRQNDLWRRAPEMLVIFVTAIVLSTDTIRNVISCKHITSILL